MRNAITAIVLILILLFISGFNMIIALGSAQTVISNESRSITVNQSASNGTANLINYDGAHGYVVDQDGVPIGNIAVTLHVWSYNGNHVPYEVFNMTNVTSNTTPFTGLFEFRIPRNWSGEPKRYCYVDTAYRTADNLTVYGKTDNYTLNMGGFDFGVVLDIPKSTPIPIPIPTPTPTPTQITTSTPAPSTAPVADPDMTKGLFFAISIIILVVGGGYCLYRMRYK